MVCAHWTTHMVYTHKGRATSGNNLHVQSSIAVIQCLLIAWHFNDTKRMVACVELSVLWVTRMVACFELSAPLVTRMVVCVELSVLWVTRMVACFELSAPLVTRMAACVELSAPRVYPWSAAQTCTHAVRVDASTTCASQTDNLTCCWWLDGYYVWVVCV